jgi:hypothetical protein
LTGKKGHVVAAFMVGNDDQTVASVAPIVAADDD